MGILYHYGIEYTDKPKLDKTLSIEGQAADSKAVGDTKISHADVVDNLESTATDLPPSANMGRELKESISTLKGSVKTIHTGTTTVSVSSGKANFTHNLNITNGQYAIAVSCTSNQNLTFPYLQTANEIGLYFFDTSFGAVTGDR